MSISEGAIALLKNAINTFQWIKVNLRSDIEVGAHTKIRNAKIAPNVKIGSYCNIGGVGICEYSYLGDYCNLPQTKIGKFTSIAGHVKLAAGNHPMDYVSTSPYTYSPIKHSFVQEKKFENEFFYTDGSKRYLCEIGNDVWIGTNALLVCGSKALHIGDGAVIAAGAVVTNDVPPYAIVAGCPAKILRYRFSEQIIDRLRQEEWWNKNQQWLYEHVEKFSEPEKYITKGR